jgi:hypothetical protein
MEKTFMARLSSHQEMFYSPKEQFEDYEHRLLEGKFPSLESLHLRFDHCSKFYFPHGRRDLVGVGNAMFSFLEKLKKVSQLEHFEVPTQCSFNFLQLDDFQDFFTFDASPVSIQPDACRLRQCLN